MGLGKKKTTTKVLNVKVAPAEDVLNTREVLERTVQLQQPIALFASDGTALFSVQQLAGASKPAASSLANEVTPQPIQYQATSPALVVENAPKAAASAPKPAPGAAAPAPKAAPAKAPGGSIEISFSASDFQIESSGQKAEPAVNMSPPPRIQAAPKPESKPVPIISTKTGAVTPAEPLISLDSTQVKVAPKVELKTMVLTPRPPDPKAPQPIAEEFNPISLDEPREPTVVLPPPAPAPAAPVIAAPAAEPTKQTQLSSKFKQRKVTSVTTPSLTEPRVPPISTAETGSGSLSLISEEEAAKDLPYLFSGAAASPMGASPKQSSKPSAMPVIKDLPSSNDVETLKKYLAVREQDISVLTVQLTYAREELAKSEEAMRRLTMQNEDLIHQLADFKRKVDSLSHEKHHVDKSMEGEVDQLRQQLKSKIDRIKFLEDRLNSSAGEYEKLKERVRIDIRKIRVRERELENKLEILKRDSETLIAAREAKILELKRKIDLLEFNYDTLQDKTESEKQNVAKGKEKLDRVLKVLKLALGVIEGEDEASGTDDDDSSLKSA